MSKKSKFLLCFTLFLSLLLSFLKYDSKVSAAATSDCFKPSKGAIWSTYVTAEDKADITDSLKRLFDRCGLNSDDYYIFIGDISTYQNRPYLQNLCIIQKADCTEQYKSDNNIYYNILVYAKSYRTSQGLASIDNINSLSFSNNTGFYKQGIFYNSDRGYGFGEIRDYGSGSIQSSPSFKTGWVFIETFNPPFDPILDPLLDYPYNLDVQRQGFLEWLLVDNKYELINGAIAQNHVGGWVDLFADYGGSQSFFKRVALQFISANNIGMGINDINDSLSVTRQLYQLYLAEKSDIVRNHLVNKLNDTENIKPDTNETNNILITNDSNDTVDTSILRDILRGILNIPNVMHDLFQILFDKLDNLNNTINIVNGGGTSPVPSGDTNIDYTDQGDFGIDEIHQYEPLPEAPDIDGDVDFLEYPSVLAQSTSAFFNLLPSDMSALMSAVLVLGVLITKIGR